MALKAGKADVWTATIEDRPGGMADKLEALAKAGANLEMVFARRTQEDPGKGILFAGPIKGAKATKAAEAAGFVRPGNIFGVRIEGGDKPGLGARITRALGDAGINFRGMTAVAIGRKFVSFISVDSAEDAAKAISAVKKLR